MQELICYLGQELVFAEASQMLLKFTGVDLSAKQIERVCHYYGEAIERFYKSERYQSLLHDEIARSRANGKSLLYYILADGSMAFTREEQWKEIKLGRIFRADKRVDRVGLNRNMITSSQYVAHLGTHKDFWEKMEIHIDEIPKKNRVFLCDGASWIWNRVEDSYPESIQIVDFFHAKEHLSDVIAPILKDGNKGTWLKEQEDRLFQNDNKAVIDELGRMKKLHPRLKDSFEREINYFSKHEARMQYGKFKELGYLIGSGPIESAHRNVIQRRLKLSGQRWTMGGLQAMVTLRAAYLSGEWPILINLIKNIN